MNTLCIFFGLNFNRPCSKVSDYNEGLRSIMYVAIAPRGDRSRAED
jgi:hypothetical protein